MRRWIEITTYLPCVNKCSYCPQEKLNKVYKGEQVMSIETFKKILKNIPEDVEIHFSGFSEPYAHPEIEEFFKLAAEKHEVCLYTSTGKKPVIPLKEYCHNPVNSVKDPISRGSNNWDIPEREGVCHRSPEFKQNVCLPDGTVVLCCMDYQLTHKLGNLLDSNFNNLVRQSTYKLCKKCESCI